jgi:CHASE2 domain-containing sensor protein
MGRLKLILQRLGIVPREPRESYFRLLLRSLPTTIFLALMMAGLEHLGVLRGFESYALDAMLRSRTTQPVSNLVIVTIDDQDYRDIFGGTSPVNPDRLEEVLRAIADGQPRVIGVDLDTSAPQFARSTWPSVMWARDARPLCPDADETADAEAACEPDDLVRLGACGGQLTERLTDKHHIETDPTTGVVVFPQDEDGVVRRYRRTFESTEAEPPSALKGEIDTLPWAVVQQYADATRAASDQPCVECDRIDRLRHEDGGHELVLNFAGDRYRFNRLPVRFLLQAAAKDYWKTDSPLRDSIVLVGGTYRAARDSYATPVGIRFGVELIAQAIESDLQGGGIRRINWAIATALDFVAGWILLYLSWRFTGRKSIWINIAGIIVLSLGASLLAFNAFAYWFNFTAVLSGIWVHMLWEHSLERRELKHELAEFRRRELAGKPA